jgi:phenylacetic acid degradation operon negative regulatory protein
VQDRHLPAIKPLTARSVALSTLLGYHPPALPVSALVRVGGLFGIAERTTRVALTRMVQDGDVVAENGVYRLTERLVRRQAQQDESSPRSRPWRGDWEMAIVTAPARALPERVALRKAMVAYRLAELREGVWIRPDNLLHEPEGAIAEQCTFFISQYPDPAELVAQLWDLAGWAAEARRLRTALDNADTLVAGFMATAEVLRHLQLDPCLPEELLPGDWPGTALREQYTEFIKAYAKRLRDYGEG